jgi:membrane-bound lytic murein transglycosylase B
VLLIALATGARGPGGGSAEAFVKPSVVPFDVGTIPESIADAAVEVARPSALPAGEQTLAVGPLDWSEIPPAALKAYQRAALIMQKSAPGCNLTWEMLAGIGRVESDHGRFGGAIVNDDGTTTPRIFGVALNGAGDVAAISDTENGTLDGDTTWDRAVGPMQFLPTTWDVVGVDADGDGIANPHDLDDAALAAGVYLCAGDVDLSDRAQLEQALWRYNPSE